jgi:hypothetical protein
VDAAGGAIERGARDVLGAERVGAIGVVLAPSEPSTSVNAAQLTIAEQPATRSRTDDRRLTSQAARSSARTSWPASSSTR